MKLKLHFGTIHDSCKFGGVLKEENCVTCPFQCFCWSRYADFSNIIMSSHGWRNMKAWRLRRRFNQLLIGFFLFQVWELKPLFRLKPVLNRCLQFQITSQLQRELVGGDHLLKPGREFVREGYLRKWAGPKGGFNARMFFLFNDCILWVRLYNHTIKFMIY